MAGINHVLFLLCFLAFGAFSVSCFLPSLGCLVALQRGYLRAGGHLTRGG